MVSTVKHARASKEALRRIFSVPENEGTTLMKLERDISSNISEFLKNHIVATQRSMSEIEQDFLDTSLPEDPTFVSEHAEYLKEKVIAHSVHISSPSFVGHMTSGLPYFMLSLSKIVTALNQNLVKVETSKAFTPLERQVLGTLHRLVFQLPSSFYPSVVQNRSSSLGTFCSCGSIANLTALWVARNRIFSPRNSFKGFQASGLGSALREYGVRDLKIFVSERGHYSFKKAADVLGLGTDGVVVVPTDVQGKVSSSGMRSAIRESKANGDSCVAVVGVAGSTETGKVDRLDLLADIAAEEGVWFHVDAAWGGPVLMSTKYRALLAGIERADSVTMDPHKQLYAPLGAGVVLFRNPQSAGAIAHTANYSIRSGSRDLGRYSIEGSRSGVSIFVHAALRVFGRKGFELLIDDGIEKAKEFAEVIKEQDDFELLSDPELNILLYRYVPKELLPLAGAKFCSSTLSRINRLTTKIQAAQRATGKSFVSRTLLRISKYGDSSIVAFRVVLANPLTTIAMLREMLKEQREIGKKLYALN